MKVELIPEQLPDEKRLPLWDHVGELRDRWMERLERRHPGYGFSRHKGYGTRLHLSALAKLGPCAAHRLTYEPVAKLAGAGR